MSRHSLTELLPKAAGRMSFLLSLESSHILCPSPHLHMSHRVSSPSQNVSFWVSLLHSSSTLKDTCNWIRMTRRTWDTFLIYLLNLIHICKFTLHLLSKVVVSQVSGIGMWAFFGKHYFAYHKTILAKTQSGYKTRDVHIPAPQDTRVTFPVLWKTSVFIRLHTKVGFGQALNLLSHWGIQIYGTYQSHFSV
jgi:hypothetical protein